MTKDYLANLNIDNEQYANAKDAAWRKVLDARDEVAKMRMSVIKSGMTQDDWQAYNELDKLYDSMSKLLNKINHKF